MSRTPIPAPLALALTLLTGLLLGVLLDRTGPFLSAQPAPPAASAPARSTATSAAPAAARPSSDDAVYDQLAKQYAQFEAVNRTFELVAKAVSPAVVHIVAAKTGRIDPSERVRHYEETGSGVIVRTDRARGLFVLTNNHVVEGSPAKRINIFLQDGRAIRPEQVWLDAKADIAVLGLGRDDLPAARLGNSDEVNVGSWVLALGSPFGLTHSVSQGIISARGRHMDELQDVENQDFLQTDAAINPGNSGGPLVNMKGEVIGINNSIASNGGGNEGVGFSIPVNLARWIMNQLITKGRVTRGALGIDLHPEFRPEDALRLGLDLPRGAWVDVVHQGSPAAAAGLRDDDVILRFRGVEIHDLNHLINTVSMAPIGQPAEVVVWRGRQPVALSVTVGERDRNVAQVNPAGPSERAAPPPRGGGGFLRRPERPAAPVPPPPAVSPNGLELQTLDEANARRLGLPGTMRGAVVLKVAPESPLATRLQPLDVLKAVNGRPVATADDAIRAFSPAPGLGTLTIRLERVVKGRVEPLSVSVP